MSKTGGIDFAPDPDSDFLGGVGEVIPDSPTQKMEDIKASSNLSFDEDVFSEAVSPFSPLFLSQQVEAEELSSTSGSEIQAAHVTPDEAGVKTEPVEDFIFYPEVTLKEECNAEFPSCAEAIKVEEGVELSECLTSPLRSGRKEYLPRVLVDSLIEQFEGELPSTEIERSVSCFVPVIPVQANDISVHGTNRKRRRLGLKQGPALVFSKLKLGRRRGRPSKKLKLDSDSNAILSPPNPQRPRGRPRKILSDTKKEPKAEKLYESIKERTVGTREKLKRLVKKSSVARCNQCSKKFKNEEALAKHLRPQKETDATTFCSDCFLDLKHLNCLRYHRRKVHNEVHDQHIRTDNFDKINGEEEIFENNKEINEEDSEKKISTRGSSRTCEICHKVFTRAAGLEYHRRQVHALGSAVERKYSCKCTKSFIRSNHLSVHMRSCQSQGRSEGHCQDEESGPENDAVGVDPDYKPKRGKKSGSSGLPVCEICHKVFTRMSGLIYHRSQVHHLGETIERKFKCTQCDKSFLKKSHLTLHGQSHTGERLFKCRFCIRSFGGTTGRRLHEEKIHGKTGEGLSVEEVEKNRAAAALLGVPDPKPQSRSRGVSQSFPCSYCSKVFIRPSAKRAHERTHTGEKPFLCMTCGNSYKSSIALKEHEKTSHSKILDLLCTVCGAAFGRQMSLKYHILSRHSDKKHQCDFEGCGRSFVQRAKLQRHQRIHAKGLVQCTICNRTLESAAQLERHLKVHELRSLKLAGIKGIVVPRNRTKSTNPRKKPPPKPRRERKTPAPIRKLQCQYCEKRFPYANELDKHEKAVHLNQRDFKCPEEGCKQAYISNYKLLYHLRNVHGHPLELSFLHDVECEICGKVCQGPARLAIHKNARHSNGSTPKPVRPRNAQTTPRRRKKGTTDAAMVQESIPVSSKESVVPSVVTEIEIESHDRQLSTTSALPISSAAIYPPIPKPQAAHTVPRNHITVRQIHEMSIAHSQQHHQQQQIPQNLRVVNSYGGQQAHEIQFLNFNTNYNSLQSPTFPYSSASHLIPSQFHQGTFDYPNTSNFWQAHQNPQTSRVQQPPHHYQQQLPHSAPPRNLDVIRDDYSSSGYSDLIHIQAPEGGYQQDADYNTDDNYSTSNVDEDYQPEPEHDEPGDEDDEPAPPPRKRGRPPKDPNAPPRPKVEGVPKKRNISKEKKPRKPYARKELPCPTCNKILSTNQHLREHLKVHETQERRKTEEYKCTVCYRKFSRPYFLHVHSVIHDPDLRPFKCNEPGCEESFRAPADFRRHRNKHSTLKQKYYKCRICREEFQASGELHKHTLEKHLDKMHACQHPGCNFICPTVGRLKRHSDQHLDKVERLRPYKCTLCDVSYIRGENLQQHMDTAHNGAGTADCKGPVWATCPRCPKKFDYAWKLKTHLRKTHGGKGRGPNWVPRQPRPLFYFCEDCDWSFADAGSLRYHIKSKHKGKTAIACLRQPCDKNYFFITKLENHIKTQHGDLSPEEVSKLTELRESHPIEDENVGAQPTKRSRKSERPQKKRSTKKREEEEDEEDDDDEEFSDDGSIYSDEEDYD